MNTVVEQFHFIRPYFLLIIPVILLFAFFSYKKIQSKTYWQTLIDPVLAKHLLSNKNNQEQHLYYKLRIFSMAFAALIATLALSGPSWEKLPEPPVKNKNAMVIIADMSLSMYSQDIKPSRLSRQRFKILELLKQRKDGLTALISYSGDAHIVSPLTDDTNNIASMVQALSPEIMPSIGSNASSAFKLASKLINSSDLAPVTFVWFTDDILKRDEDSIIQSLNNSRANLITIGMGTSHGGPIPLPSGMFLKNAQENIVQAKLPIAQLKQFNSNVSGLYLSSTSDNHDIQTIINKTNTSIDFNSSNTNNNLSNTENSKNFDRWLDRGAWVSLLLIPFALMLFRRGWVLHTALIVMLSLTMKPETLQAQSLSDNNLAPSSTKKENTHTTNGLLTSLFKNKNQKGLEQFKSGDFTNAKNTFNDTSWQGISAFKEGDFGSALEFFQQNTENNKTKKNDLPASHYYNLGHALALNKKFEDALTAYEKALELNPEFGKAKKAKDIIESLLQNQQNQQQQQENNQENSQDQQQSSQQNAENNPEQNQQQNQEGNQDQSEQNETGKQQESQANSGETSKEKDAANQNDSLEEDIPEFRQGKEQQEKNTVNEEKQLASQLLDEKQQKDHEQKNNELTEKEKTLSVKNAKLQQWLNQIEDDPSGLLRRKFQYERQLRERQGEVIDKSEDGKLW